MFPYHSSTRHESGNWTPAYGWVAFALLIILLGLSLAR